MKEPGILLQRVDGRDATRARLSTRGSRGQQDDEEDVEGVPHLYFSVRIPFARR